MLENFFLLKLKRLFLACVLGWSNICEYAEVSLNRKYYTSLKNVANPKHSSLFIPAISDEEKKVLQL
jgi:hypothetical protein